MKVVIMNYEASKMEQERVSVMRKRRVHHGGDETRSGDVQYVQGIQPNVPARTMFIDIYQS